MSRDLVRPLARILAASTCDLGDERDAIRVLRAAGIPEGDIIVFMDDAVDLARILRTEDMEVA